MTEHVSPESQGQYSAIQEQPFNARCSSCQNQFINGVSSQTRQTRVVWTSLSTSSRCGITYSSVADDQSHDDNIAFFADLLLRLKINARRTSRSFESSLVKFHCVLELPDEVQCVRNFTFSLSSTCRFTWRRHCSWSWPFTLHQNSATAASMFGWYAS